MAKTKVRGKKKTTKTKAKKVVRAKKMTGAQAVLESLSLIHI